MKFPYKAFLLSPTMKITPVIVEGQWGYLGSWLKLQGKVTTAYKDRIFRTKDEAIYAAEKALAITEARLKTGAINLAKKRETLAKQK